MKKLLFIAMVCIAGSASAKGNVEKVNSKTKEVTTVTKKPSCQKKILSLNQKQHSLLNVEQ